MRNKNMKKIFYLLLFLVKSYANNDFQEMNLLLENKKIQKIEYFEGVDLSPYEQNRNLGEYFKKSIHIVIDDKKMISDFSLLYKKRNFSRLKEWVTMGEVQYGLLILWFSDKEKIALLRSIRIDENSFYLCFFDNNENGMNISVRDLLIISGEKKTKGCIRLDGFYYSSFFRELYKRIEHKKVD